MGITIHEGELPDELQGIGAIATQSAQKEIDSRLSGTFQKFLSFVTSASIDLLHRRRDLTLEEQTAMAKDVIAIVNSTTMSLQAVLERTIDPSKREKGSKSTDIPLDVLLKKLSDIDIKAPSGNFREHGTSGVITRMKNALNDNKILYLGDLIQLTPQQLSAMPGFGSGVTNAILRTLKLLKLSLGTKLNPVAKADFEKAKLD